MRPWLLACMMALALAGCADPAAFRFQGSLDRAMTQEESAELRALLGQEPEMGATLVACAPSPGFDDYDCNDHFVIAEGYRRAECQAILDAISDRTYWKRPPSCYDPADTGNGSTSTRVEAHA